MENCSGGIDLISGGYLFVVDLTALLYKNYSQRFLKLIQKFCQHKHQMTEHCKHHEMFNFSVGGGKSSLLLKR